MTSPQHHNALLWGQQLKREIAVVHKQYEQMRTSQVEQDRRLQAIETTTNQDHAQRIAALDHDVRDLDSQGLQRRFQSLEQNVQDNLDNMHATNTSMATKVDALEMQRKAHQGELAIKEETILRRVAEAEAGLNLYRQNLEKLQRQPNESQLGMIRAELERLRNQLSESGREMSLQQASLMALEASIGELRRANERLGEEMGRLKAEAMIHERSSHGRKAVLKKSVPARPTGSVALDGSNLSAGSIPKVNAQQVKNKRRSHPQLKGEQSASHGNDSSLQVERPNKRPKPQHLSGVITEQRIKSGEKLPASTSKAKFKASSQSSTWTHEGSNGAEKPIIRAGKGWIEIAEDVDETSSSDEDSLLAVNGLDNGDHASTQRLTRRARAQLKDRREHRSRAEGPDNETRRESKQDIDPDLAPATRPGKLPPPRKSYPPLPTSSSFEPSAELTAGQIVSPDAKVEIEVEYEMARRRRVIEQSSDDVFVFDDA